MISEFEGSHSTDSDVPTLSSFVAETIGGLSTSACVVGCFFLPHLLLTTLGYSPNSLRFNVLWFGIGLILWFALLCTVIAAPGVVRYCIDRLKHYWSQRSLVKRSRLYLLPISTQQIISETRADIEYEYHVAMSEGRSADARAIRRSGRFIVIKAALFDLVVTFFEYITQSVTSIFRIG